MDVKDFNRWLAHYSACFPDTAEWLESLRTSQETKILWRDALADVSLTDAKEITQRLVKGDLPAIPAYDREKTPAIVRGHAQTLLGERIARLPDSTPLWREEKVRCKTCRDIGYVDVWSYKAMELVHHGGSVRSLNPRHRLEAIRCSCERGFPRGVDPSQNRTNERNVEKTPRLGECKVLVTNHGDVTSPAAIEAFEIWVSEMVAQKYENMQHSEFNHYNDKAQSDFDKREPVQ